MIKMKIDSHQHFWRYDPAEYAWIDNSMQGLRHDFLPQDAKREMTRAGFDAGVAVQARQTLEETRWLLSLADAHPTIAGVVGWVDLRADDARAQLQRFAGHPRLVGIRHIVQDEADDRFLLRPEFCRGIALLGEFGLAYDILIHTRHLPVAAEFVARFDAQPFVLDHLAKPPIRSREVDAWARDLQRLAKFPNVMAKLSGLVTEADRKTWTLEHIRPYLDLAFNSFGANRLMIGSDWPVCAVAADYARTMGIITDYVSHLSRDERVAVLGGNAQRFWSLKAAALPGERL